MEKLTLMGLGTALGATLGALGVLAGQRIGLLPPADTPGDPWQTDRERTAGDTAGAVQDAPLRYLTVGEVAELLGMTTADLTRDPDLPEPDATVGRTRGWLESTIEGWLPDHRAQVGGRTEP